MAAAGARITQARGVRKARFASRLLEATAATNVLCRGRDGALVEVEVAVSEKKTPNDVRGNVVTQTRKLDGLSYLVRRNYDQTGYLRGVLYPDGEVIGSVPGEASSGAPLGYDALGRLTTIPGILNNVTYSVLGAPLVQTNANGTTTTKTYDPNRFWLTGIQTTNLTSGLSLQNLQYGLNEAGLADSVTSDVPSESRTYGYDGLNRLTSATNASHSTVNQEWAYDTLGRFTSNSRVGTTFTYPNAGQPRPHAPTQISGGSLGALTFIYDANGNMTAGNGRAMAWDANNRIREVTAGGNTTTFVYGPDGTRVKKISGSSVVKYPFGDDYEIGGNGVVTKYFDAGFGPIAKKVGTSVSWLHSDRLGSINAMTDATGAQVLRRSHRSYGELIQPGPQPSEQPIEWTATVNTKATIAALWKTSASAGWDAGATSTQQLNGDGYVEVTMGGPDQHIMFGLTNESTNESYPEIDFAIYMACLLYTSDAADE